MLPEDKQPIPRDITDQADAEQKVLMDYTETQFRKLSAYQCLKWDKMTDEERIDIVDDFIHEDHECKQNSTLSFHEKSDHAKSI